MQIRDVTAADVPSMAALADAKRTEYATYSPVFWRKSDNGMEVQTRFFTNRMLPSDTINSLVADRDGTIEGFVIGMIREAPPVYDPGGPVCWIDDFTVARPELWETVGTALYREATIRAQQRGVVAMVTIAGHLDMPKRAMLQAQDVPITVETYVQALQQPQGG
jgi:hypothetical protein